MKSIFDYFEYREFLNDFYVEKKARTPIFSYRYISSKVGLHPSHLIRVLQKKRHISQESIRSFCKLLKFSKTESRFFEALVAFNKAKSEKKAREEFDRLLKLMPIEKQNLSRDQLELFTKWYYSAIYVLMTFESFGNDFDKLATRLSPPITRRQASDAVALLQRLGLVAKDVEGHWRPARRFLTTGEEWRNVAVREFQKEVLGLAAESLDRHRKDRRDISTVTISVPRDRLPELREYIRDFRSGLLSIANDGDEFDDVYQIAISLFPMTGRGSKK
jgi:uncharacterized protein (TIGR02147 family)